MLNADCPQKGWQTGFAPLLILDLINQVCSVKCFMKLDVWWGYQNVQKKEGDEWKAAFCTSCRLFKPLVMFFSLTNSPSTFQTMMNEIFQDLDMEGVVCVYLNDILIYTKFIDEHHCITHLVLAWLHEHKLFLWHDRCEFKCTQIEYLGLVVAQGSIAMDLVKVTGVTEWPVSKMKKEVQSFFRFASFHYRFIEGFSHHTWLLFNLTKKDVTWTWGGSQQKAFNKLKDCIASSPVLWFADDSLQFCVEANSSDFATGAVLSQQSPEGGKWHPILFYSKLLNDIEWNYEIHKRRCLWSWMCWRSGIIS